VEWTSIIYAAASVGGLGLVFGLGLGVAAKKFAVKVDPLVPQVRELLPGANCGGCGYAGCDAFAKALAAGETTPEKCGVNSDEGLESLSKLLGLEVEKGERQVAFVKCNGTCDKAKEKYEYYGITDCNMIAALQGKGAKGCQYGCEGLGSCVNVCMFDAIHVVDGVAVVDEEKCTACGMCITACPKNIIELVPESAGVRVQCNSNDKGKVAKDNCSVSCIGCKMCERVCEFDAVKVDNFLAKIDYNKCTECNACVEKCPTKAIHNYKQ